MNRMQTFLIIGALIVLVAVVAWLLFPRTVVSPSPVAQQALPTEVNSTASSSVEITPTINQINRSATFSLPLAEINSITYWDFRGAYTDNPELVLKAQAEIKRLSELLVTATSSKMILSVGIANQYELLGEGKEQYKYLLRAISANETNGLPWHNLGVLLDRLGALKTARIAYERAAILQPQLAFYHYAYIEFLIANMKSDITEIEKAFSAAEKNIGKTQYLSDLRASWQNP